MYKMHITAVGSVRVCENLGCVTRPAVALGSAHCRGAAILLALQGATCLLLRARAQLTTLA
jgi:hypothetical protein